MEATASSPQGARMLIVRWRRLARRRPAVGFGLGLVLAFTLVAVLGPSMTPYGPTETNPRSILESPSPQFPFGTDKFGRDILTRVVHAASTDLGIAASVALSAFLVGSLIG